MKEATATQPVKESTGLRITTTADLFDQTRQAYNAIAQRAFEVFENRAQLFGPELEDWLRAEDWFRAEAELLHPVHVRIVEAEGSLTVEAEVPGFTAEDLEVNLESRRLTISGKRQIEEKPKDKKTVYTERCANQVLRVIDLPAEVDTSKATATLKDGILQLTMQKANAVKNVRVDAKVA